MGPVQASSWDKTSCVSILLASYCSGKTLPEALHSVFAQDWPNLDIILCDDGTPGFDQDIIWRQFYKENRGNCSLRVLHQPHNVGTVRNLNAALSYTSGEWIFLMAADDVIAGSDVISRLCCQANRTGADWIVSRLALCDDRLCPTGRECPGQDDLKLLSKGDIKAVWERLCVHCFLPSGGMLYRRTLLTGGFDESYRIVEDWPLFLSMVRAGRLPEVCDICSILHRGAGVSSLDAGENRIYQTDLVITIRQQILPQLSWLPEKTQVKIRLHCMDKLTIYQMRFEFTSMTMGEKAMFIIRNQFLLPLLVRRGFMLLRDMMRNGTG